MGMSIPCTLMSFLTASSSEGGQAANRYQHQPQKSDTWKLDLEACLTKNDRSLSCHVVVTPLRFPNLVNWGTLLDSSGLFWKHQN